MSDGVPTADLFAGALAEIQSEDERGNLGNLIALHERPTREVFEMAVTFTRDRDPVKRRLGVRVLRELGPGPSREDRPFRRQAIPRLVEMLHGEDDLEVLGWVISALGYNGAYETLHDVLRFIDHPAAGIRFMVAATLPSLVDHNDVDPMAVRALETLSRDADADIRYYALHALVAENLDLAPSAIDPALAAALLADPDEQIRALAAEYLGPGR